MELTVIISYYKAIDNLKIILKALNNQSRKGFEVILSEDDNNVNTLNYLHENRSSFNFPIIHLNQKEDKGFRKNEMLNKSIMKANSERLAFIDGDCVPHKHFVKEYVLNLKEGCFYAGRAVMLSKKASETLLKKESLKGLNVLLLLLSNSDKVKVGIYSPFFSLSIKSRGLVGRNWGVMKKHLVSVNGFDEDYVFAGVGEDVDIEWRLLDSGIKRKSIKNKAIVYHIYHPKGYSEDNVRLNYVLLEKKKQLNNIKCLSGIQSIGTEKHE